MYNSFHFYSCKSNIFLSEMLSNCVQNTTQVFRSASTDLDLNLIDYFTNIGTKAQDQR